MAVLFAAGEPVDAKRLSQTLEHDEAEIHEACKTLMDELSFNRSGIRIVRLENAYQMCSSPEMAEYVTKTLETRKPPKLSPSQLETLTVIAYYQPATKALVEQIRGVDSAYCVSALVTKKLIRECKPIHFDGNGYSDEWKAEAARRGLDCETSTPLIFDRYLTPDSIRMFESTGVLNKVEIEARTEVKWETYTKKIQIEGRVLGDLTMNHIVPIASRYEAMLLDKVYKMAQIGGLDASADIDLLKKIQGHTAAIQTLTIEMIEARKKANRIENARAKAIAYHDTVEVYFEEIRRHIDKLEEIIDDQMWTLPKYRELLFIK